MLNVNGVSLRFGKRVLFEEVNIKFTKGQYLQNNPGLTFDNNIYVKDSSIRNGTKLLLL